MTSPDALLSAGRPRAALDALQAEVRARAGDVKLRVLLFQLLCVLGQWDRAAKQLETCGEMDDANLGMVAMYRDAVSYEALRAAVFAGRTTPIVAGQPAPWVAWLIEALRADGRAEHDLAERLRAQAFEAAPTTRGTLNGEPFDWIADADSRLGPVLEAVVNGSYQWIPFDGLAKIVVEEPTDLRDLVWQPARLTLAGGGETVALLPVRYAETTTQDEESLLLARRTEWIAIGDEQYRGLGQRLFASDVAEVGLLEVREIILSGASPAVSVH